MHKSLGPCSRSPALLLLASSETIWSFTSSVLWTIIVKLGDCYSHEWYIQLGINASNQFQAHWQHFATGTDPYLGVGINPPNEVLSFLLAAVAGKVSQALP